MAYSEAKTLKELNRLETKAKKPTRWFHLFLVSFVILCLAYVIDEIASNINNIVQTDVLNTFFNGSEGYSKYLIITTLCSGISFFTFFYKALSDRFGRKAFLVINTIGLSIGMFICFLSKNVVLYSLGLVVMYFFTPCDIQVVYILETANPKKRALYLSIAKAIATLGIILVPSLRTWATSLGTNTWNYVFLIPACIGLVVGFICLLFVRESPAFIESRTAILKEKLENGGKELSKDKKLENAEGGIIAAIKFMVKRKPLMWLFFIALIYSISVVGVLNFGFMISDAGSESNTALIVYPISCAILQVVIGFLADILGRKKASIIAGALTFVGIILFTSGSHHHFPGVITGIALGSFVAGYYSILDMTTVMCSEESPTNLRSSIMSLIGVASSIGSFIPVALLVLIGIIAPKANLMICVICMVVPSILAGTILLMIFVPETYHNSLTQFKEMFKREKKTKK